MLRCRCLDDRFSFDLPEGRAVVVGRDPRQADVVIPKLAISRRHVRFSNEGGQCFIEALEILGSVLINGERVSRSERKQLTLGDQVLLLSEVVFVIEDREVQAE